MYGFLMEKQRFMREALPEIVCEHCKERFVPKTLNQKYCTHTCQQAAARAKRKRVATAFCKTCGKAFAPINANHLYCCEDCRPSKHVSQRMEHNLNRPFTQDTVFLVCKWYREGMSVKQLAKLLYRSQESIQKALAIGNMATQPENARAEGRKAG